MSRTSQPDTRLLWSTPRLAGSTTWSTMNRCACGRPARPTLADGLPDAIARLRRQTGERPTGGHESR
jgi:hypothetical protein